MITDIVGQLLAFASTAGPVSKCSVDEVLTAAAHRIQELEKSLAELVVRCDGEEGMRADGSNIDTRAQAAVLWPDDEEDE